MTLKDLVYLRNELLNAIQVETIKNEIKANLSRLDDLASMSKSPLSDYVRDLAGTHAALFLKLDSDIEVLQTVVDEVNKEILELTTKFYTDNYQTELTMHDPALIREMRKAHFPDHVQEILLSRIRIYSSWKYPALEIGCRDGEYTKHLVSSDPLYIADDFSEFLDNTIKQFTPEYQLRLRNYNVRNGRIFFLPKNQFNFIFSFNYFNYLSLDSIKQFLHQATEWLRPGGVMLFTYNNGDMPVSAGLSENYFMTYVPKSMLIPLIESFGFEIIATEDHEPSASWVEIKKPGVLTTVKAHQVLGEIKYR